MRLHLTALTLLCMAAVAGEARAQVVWDSPFLLTPRPASGTGLYLMEAHGAGVGVLGTWRGVPAGIGLRLGVFDGSDGIAILGGADFQGAIATVSPQFPLDIAWVAGVGAGHNRWTVVSAPLGLSIGRTFGAPDVRLTPHLIPRVALDAHLGRDRPRERNELRLNLGVDLGIDLAFQPGWAIRFGAGLGSRRSGIAVGLIF